MGSSASVNSFTACPRDCRAASAAASPWTRDRDQSALLLFDDPTTGVDPVISATVDDEIVKLRDLERGDLHRRHSPDPRCRLHRDAQDGA